MDWNDLEEILINLEQSAGKANYLICDLLEIESKSAIKMLSQILLDYVLNIEKDIKAASKLYHTLSESATDKSA